MIAPDDLDLEIRSLVDLAGADAPPAPNLKLGRRVPGHTWPTRRTIGAAAALILVVGSATVAIALRSTETRIESVDSAVSTGAADVASTTVGDTTGNSDAGEPIATLELPALNNLRVVVYPDVGPESLAEGTGHLPSTPRPGEFGNSVIEGHRPDR